MKLESSLLDDLQHAVKKRIAEGGQICVLDAATVLALIARVRELEAQASPQPLQGRDLIIKAVSHLDVSGWAKKAGDSGSEEAALEACRRLLLELAGISR